MFSINSLSFSYFLNGVEIVVLNDLSLEIKEGKVTTLLGPSGSGKSTLLNLLGLIEPMQKGQIFFNGKSYDHLSKKGQNHLRLYEMGFVFQQFHLIPVLTAEENVAYFLKTQGLKRSEIELRVKDALKAVGLWEHRMKKPNEMSGGQKQRVAIARALAKRPQVILADEPTASLDQMTGQQVIKIFHDLAVQEGVSVVIATHDPMVTSFAHESFHLKDGRLI